MQQPGDDLEVGDERFERGLTFRGIAAQDRGWVNGGDERTCERHIAKNVAALAGDAELRAHERLGGGCAQGDQHLGVKRFQLGIEPRTARGDFAGARLLVQPAFADRLPLEMLHCIRDEYIAAFDVCGGEGLVEQPAGRADEGPAVAILAITGLLTDEDHAGLCRAFAKDSLRADLP